MIKKRVNISDHIYNIIKQDILNGVLDFGEKIIEQNYATRLNVSRTPLREALKKLEMEGIIIRQPNGRLKIVEIDKNQIWEIYQIRIALENIILENSINNIKILTKLERILKKNQQEIEQKEWDDARLSILQFSEEMLNNSQYQFSLKILDQYNFFIAKLKKRSLITVDRIIQAYEDHCLLYKYLKQKDVFQLQKTNKIHLTTACTTILTQLENK